MASSSASTILVNLEFGGGLEQITHPPQARSHKLRLPTHVPIGWSAKSKPSSDLMDAVDASRSAGSAAAHDAKLGVPASDKPIDMRYLVWHVKTHLVAEREEMLCDGEGVRAGMLVLINDTDWELMGELDAPLEDGDQVTLISTLHGG
ncbi:ubiquitin related modifier 1 [Ceraceosorus guamensis]|uniref:Ubiquitin-related modifier 1 n=1 Tax=Ceraceosorus guamensis TaxID=1522189 RepID=A0A316W071_9BASI|nr:ubiquitin related modifier 1 [Ceraceosorus guamensis]PWN41095.1 ubiquitin related modifier 1 [Ceraceosorus guamensis]